MKNKSYQSDAFWRPDEQEIVDLKPNGTEGPAAQWAIAECARRNEAMKLSSLGEATGWPSKWLTEIDNEPTGEGWLKAFEKAKDVIKNNGILILHGTRGPGKTRMAAELALYACESRYRTAMRFFLEIRATFKSSSETTEMEIIDAMVGTNLLIIDELQERGDTAFEDRLLTHVIDARYAENKPTLLIANLSKQGLSESLGASVVDRYRENGAAIEFTWPSFRPGRNKEEGQ
jgi:DNA replication protein DnaC